MQRTVARNGFRPQTWRFGWNAQDQMVRAHCPDGDVWTYRYDPFGRRISKACKHTKVTFIWDGDVIAREITETAARVDVVDWFFEPGSFRPMARLEAGDLTFVINDHLGTPKEVVDGDGGLRWSADHDTWGTLRVKRGAAAAQVETGDYWVEPTSIEGNLAQAYAPNPEALYCPIRFQGQWDDGETGLYYNRFRYLEPLFGQYVSPDPIGILGGYRGPNSYVSSTSIFFDALGLVDSTWNGVPFNQQLSTLQSAHPGVNFHFPSGQHTNATAGHWQSMLSQADEWAGSGNYNDIYLNQGINNEFGPSSISPNNRPDVMGVRPNGQIDMVEVPSTTDTEANLRNRMNQAQSNIASCCAARGIPSRAGTTEIRLPSS